MADAALDPTGPPSTSDEEVDVPIDGVGGATPSFPTGGDVVVPLNQTAEKVSSIVYANQTKVKGTYNYKLSLTGLASPSWAQYTNLDGWSGKTVLPPKTNAPNPRLNNVPTTVVVHTWISKEPQPIPNRSTSAYIAGIMVQIANDAAGNTYAGVCAGPVFGYLLDGKTTVLELKVESLLLDGSAWIKLNNKKNSYVLSANFNGVFSGALGQTATFNN